MNLRQVLEAAPPQFTNGYPLADAPLSPLSDPERYLGQSSSSATSPNTSPSYRVASTFQVCTVMYRPHMPPVRTAWTTQAPTHTVFTTRHKLEGTLQLGRAQSLADARKTCSAATQKRAAR